MAEGYDRVVAVQAQPFTPGDPEQPVTSPAYFAAVADRIAPAVLAALGVRVPVGPPR